MSIIKQLKWRYATKQFDKNKQLSSKELDLILEAANLAPTSMGLQPFKIFVVENPDIRLKLREAAWNQPQVTDASHILIFAVKSELTAVDADVYLKLVSDTRKASLSDLSDYRAMLVGGIEGKSVADRRNWAARQAYIALGTVLTTCALEGIDACPMEGFAPDGFDKILGLNDLGWSSVVMVAVGSRAHDDKYQHLEKVRKSMTDLVTFI